MSFVNKITRPPGRPLEEGKPNDIPLGTRVDSELAETIGSNVACYGENFNNAKWTRLAARNEARAVRIWAKSKWDKSDLDGKLIKFKLTSPVRQLSGIGKLSVFQNDQGQISVDIFIDEPAANGGITCTRIWLAEDAIQRIQPYKSDSESVEFIIDA